MTASGRSDDRFKGSMTAGPLSKKGNFTLIEDSLDDASRLDASAKQERDLYVVRLMWSHRLFLFRAALVGFIASLLVAFLIPKRYTSTTRLMPPDQQSIMGVAVNAAIAGKTGGGGLASLAGDFLGIKNSGDLFVGMLQSRTVQEHLVDKFDLCKAYRDRRSEDARTDLAKRTEISQDRKSGIISVSVTDENATRAANMAAEYVAELDRIVNQLSTSSAHRERIFLEERLSEVKDDLEHAEQEFSQFASKNAAIDIKEQGRAMVEAAAVVEGNLIAAQSELQGLKQIYNDNHVRVRAAEARIADLRNQLQKLGGTQSSAANADADTDSAGYPTIRRLPILGVTYADLYRRTKVDEAVFEALTQEYELAKVEEAKNIPSVKVLDQADVPDKKSFPPRSLIVFFGTVTALVLASLWTLGAARWEEADPGDPKKALLLEIVTETRTSALRLRRFGQWRWPTGRVYPSGSDYKTDRTTEVPSHKEYGTTANDKAEGV